MCTKIFIERHAETVGNIQKRLTGRKDYELTPKGEKSVESLAKYLNNIDFDKFYSSMSERTKKTIAPLATKNSKEITQLEELDEMYFGIYDGWKWEDVNKVQPEIKQNQNMTNEICGIPEQETTKEVAERMYKCITKIAKENYGKTILICSHGVAIEAFLRKITKDSFYIKRKEYCQHNVALNELEFKNNKYIIKQLANTDYLL